MDFGKYVYEQQKKAKDSKTTTSKVKEVKFRPRVEQHDYETKMRHAEQFLLKGNKVKLTLSFRGREMSHTEIGFVTIRRAVEDLETMGHADNEPRLMGRNINVMMSPLPVHKRKPKFLRPDDEHRDFEQEQLEAEANEEHDDEDDDTEVSNEEGAHDDAEEGGDDSLLDGIELAVEDDAVEEEKT